MTVTIYHNPRCSKSRETLAMLEERGYTPDVVRYMDTLLEPSIIEELLQKLGFNSARELMRTKEAIYKELALETIDDESALLKAMSEHPKLIERPIVVNGQKAALGRPPEQVLAIL